MNDSSDELRIFLVYWVQFESGKRYVGITKDLLNRIRVHRHYAKNPKKLGYPLHKAFHVHGFSREMFQVHSAGLTKKEAEDLEISLIKQWRTTDRSHGYNVTSGGSYCDGMNRVRGVKHHNYGRNLPAEMGYRNLASIKRRVIRGDWKIFESYREAARDSGIAPASEDNVGHAVRSGGRVRGWLFKKYDGGPPEQYFSEKQKYPLFRKDNPLTIKEVGGDVLGTLSHIREKYGAMFAGGVGRVLTGRRKTYLGKRFIYVET